MDNINIDKESSHVINDLPKCIRVNLNGLYGYGIVDIPLRFEKKNGKYVISYCHDGAKYGIETIWANTKEEAIRKMFDFCKINKIPKTPQKTFSRDEIRKMSANALKVEQNMNIKLIRLTESDLHKIVKESVNRILRESNVLKESYDKDFVEFEDIKKGILSCQGLRPSEKHSLLNFWKKHEHLLYDFNHQFYTFSQFAAEAEEEYPSDSFSEPYPKAELPEGWTLKDIYYTTKHIISDMGSDNINYNDYEGQLY